MKDFLKKIAYLGIIRKTYSQDKEDLFLMDYFNKTDSGFYVDIGCHHPKRFSNTYLLYKKGWNGINIDANKLTISLFNIFRARDKNYCFVLSTSSKLVEFYEFSESALNGILNSREALKLEQLGYVIKKKRKIRPIPVKEFISKNKLKNRKINLLKIDIEGMDCEIVKNMDISEMDIDVLMIEKSDDVNNSRMENYLKSFSYSVLHETKRNLLFKKN